MDTALRITGLETFEALREAGSAKLAQLPRRNGAEYGNAPLARRLQDVARLIRSGVGLQVAVTDIGGWDTHVGRAPRRGSSRRGWPSWEERSRRSRATSEPAGGTPGWW